MTTQPRRILAVEEIKAIQQMRKAIFRVRLMGRGVLEIPTPFMMASFKSPADLEHTVYWMTQHDAENFHGIVVPQYNAKWILQNVFTGTNQHTLRTQNPYENIRNGVIIADPSTELAYYNRKTKIEEYSNLPVKYKAAITYRQNKKEAQIKYEAFMQYVETSTNAYVLSMLTHQITVGANLLLAPSTLILNEDETTLTLSIKINRATKQISELHEGWEYAYNFVFHVSNFEDDIIPAKILQVIAQDKPKRVVFKIEGIDYLDNRNAYIQRINLKHFLHELRQLTKQHEIATLFLNADILGIFMVYSGLDAFSTPVDGTISQRAYSSKNKHLSDSLKGHWFYYSIMAFVPFRTLVKKYGETGEIPCPNGCCEGITNYNIARLERSRKARFCRVHYLNTINAYLKELHEGIQNDNVVAFSSKLMGSACLNYKDMLPSELGIPEIPI